MKIYAYHNDYAFQQSLIANKDADNQIQAERQREVVESAEHLSQEEEKEKDEEKAIVEDSDETTSGRKGKKRKNNVQQG